MVTRWGKGNDCDLHRVQQVQLDLLRVRLGLARVHPEDAPHVLRREYHLRPVPPALGIPLVRRRAAEGETKADHEAGDGEKDGVDSDCGWVSQAALLLWYALKTGGGGLGVLAHGS